VCGSYLCASYIDNWPSGITAEEQQEIITKVEQLIDKVTETKWSGTPFDIKLNGNGKNRLFLPLGSDILTVSNVYISCVELDSSWYTWDVNSIYLDPCVSGSGSLSPELYYKLGEAMEGGIFPRGYNNIWVIGTMGEGEFADIPEAIKQAAVILAKWENDPTLYTYMGLKKSEKIGDYAYTNLIVSEEDILTGVMEADTFLRLYVKRKPIVLAP
ncbi:MAG: hypothetical protein KAV87_52135, partial [Desulfobacteraceae bacterium]|nr:hypothetical protein [Desulfobacteraceae bacterium]